MEVSNDRILYHTIRISIKGMNCAGWARSTKFSSSKKIHEKDYFKYRIDYTIH